MVRREPGRFARGAVRNPRPMLQGEMRRNTAVLTSATAGGCRLISTAVSQCTRILPLPLLSLSQSLYCLPSISSIVVGEATLAFDWRVKQSHSEWAFVFLQKGVLRPRLRPVIML